MRVLAAVFANPGHISLDVAGVQRRVVEGRREQQDQVVIRAGRDARRPTAMARRARPGSAAPEITAHDCAIASMRAGIAAGGAERRAVVEVGAAVPAAVPRLSLDRRLERRGMGSPSSRARVASPRAAAIGAQVVRTVCRNHASHTLSPVPCDADAIHAVVPVACAHQRKAVRCRRRGCGRCDRARSARTASRARRDARLEVRLHLASGQHRPVEERDGLVQDRPVAGNVEIVACHVRQPEQVVGDAGPHPAAQPARATSAGRRPSTNWRDAAFRICARVRSGRDTASAMTSCSWSRKPIGAAGLVERRSRPDAAGKRLIEEPLVQHQVERAIGSLHLDRAQHVVPAVRDRLEPGFEIVGSVARDQRTRLFACPGLAEQQDDRRGASGGDLRARSAGRSRGRAPAPVRPESGSRRPRAAGRRAVPFRPRNSVRSPVQAVCAAAEIGEGDPGAEVPAPGIAREHRPGRVIHFGDDEWRRSCSASHRAPTRGTPSPTGGAVRRNDSSASGGRS